MSIVALLSAHCPRFRRGRGLLLVLLLPVSGLQPVAARQGGERIPPAYRQLLFAMATNDQAEFDSLLQHLLQQPDILPSVWETAAVWHAYAGRFREGEDWLGSLQVEARHAPEIQGALAILRLYEKRPGECFAAARRAVSAGCRMVWPYELFAFKSFEIESSAVAYAQLQDLAQRHPENWRLRHGLAVWHAARNDPQSATRILRRLLAEGIRHWRLYYLHSNYLAYTGRNQASWDTVQVGLDFCRSNGEVEGHARLLFAGANAEMALGRPKEALRSRELSLALARQTGNLGLQNTLRLAEGSWLMTQNHWARAADTLALAVKQADRLADGSGLMSGYYHLAQLNRLTGYWSAATTFTLRAKAVADSLGREEYSLQMLYFLGIIDLVAGRPEQALRRFLDHEEVMKQKGFTLHRSFYNQNLGGVYLALGQYDSALVRLETSLALALGEGRVSQIAKIRIMLADVLFQRGDRARARSLLDEVERAAVRAGQHTDWLESQIMLGRLLLAENQPAEARNVLDRTVTVSTQPPPYLTYLDIVRLLAEANARAGDEPRALGIYESAVEAMIAHTPFLRPAQLSTLAGQEREIFFGLSRAYLRARDHARALQVAEQAHDLLVRRKQWQALLLRKAQWDSVGSQRWQELDALLLETRMQQVAASSPQQTIALAGRVKDLELQRDALLQQLVPDFTVPTLVLPALDLSTLQRGLAQRQEAAVSYFVSDSLALAFFLAGDALTGELIHAGHRQLRRLLDDIHALLQPHPAAGGRASSVHLDTVAAAAAYDLLLRPFLTGRPEQRLAIVPDDVLHALPFDLLVDRAAGASRPAFLVQRYAIRNGVSLASLQPAGAEQLVVRNFHLIADPDFRPANGTPQAAGLSFLPVGREEMRMIQQLCRVRTRLTGRNASRQNTLAALQQADWLHLASHSLGRPQEPLFGELVLAVPNSQSAPERIHAFEIFSLQTTVRLAILSGCETARGPFLSGEGFEGFVQAFRAAGTPSVIASLWKVDDHATAQFFRAYYDSLRQVKSASRALQAAKLAMLASPNYSVLDWAAFSYYGRDWQVTMEEPETSVYWVLLLVILLLLAGVYLARSLRRRARLS